jgi:hypothetical protein
MSFPGYQELVGFLSMQKIFKVPITKMNITKLVRYDHFNYNVDTL